MEAVAKLKYTNYIMLYLFSISKNVDNYIQRIHSIIRKNNSEGCIILCIKFQRSTGFAFSFTLFLITYSYQASFYRNVIKAQ